MTDPGPDFAAVTSEAIALDLLRAGRLEVLLLLPIAFGGSADEPRNRVYVPPGVVDIKRGIDENVVTALVHAGKVTRYVAEPRYEGKSVVPTALTLTASEPGSFTTTIAIWGSAEHA